MPCVSLEMVDNLLLLLLGPPLLWQRLSTVGALAEAGGGLASPALGRWGVGLTDRPLQGPSRVHLLGHDPHGNHYFVELSAQADSPLAAAAAVVGLRTLEIVKVFSPSIPINLTYGVHSMNSRRKKENFFHLCHHYNMKR